MSDEDGAVEEVPDRPWITVAEALSLRVFDRAWGADVLKKVSCQLLKPMEITRRLCLTEATQDPRCAPFARRLSEVENSRWNGRRGRPTDAEAVKAALDDTPQVHWPPSAQEFLSHFDADREFCCRLLKASTELWEEAYAERVQLRGQRCSPEPSRSRDRFRALRQPLPQLGGVEFITSHFFRTPPVYDPWSDRVVPGRKHPAGAPAFYGVEVAREAVVRWLEAKHVEESSEPSQREKKRRGRPPRYTPECEAAARQIVAKMKASTNPSDKTDTAWIKAFQEWHKKKYPDQSIPVRETVRSWLSSWGL